MKKKIITSGLLAVLILIGSSMPTAALQPDRAYNYTTDNQPVASPNLYEVEKVIYGNHLGCGDFKEPRDFFVDKNNHLYILDSENARIVILDEKYQLIKTLDTFNTANGEVHTISYGAEGLFYQESTGLLYVADTYNDRLLISDLDGNIRHLYTMPQTDLIEAYVSYQPSKVIVDNNGNIYVLSKNINTGAVMTDSNNNFIGFYGTNKIKASFTVQMEKMWRKLLGDQDNESADYSFQPVQYNNLFWGSDRFIYAVSTKNEYLTSEVSKLNAVGDSVLSSSAVFGDPNLGSEEFSTIVDIAVSENGLFTILDQYNCKLYTYDSDSNLLGAFGAPGEQEGLFEIPTAISYNMEGDLLVLDAEKGNITVFSPTYYQTRVEEAITLFHDGLYEESIEPWNDVLRMNVNFRLAYVGIGKANMMLGDYETAMENFKLGNNSAYYSDAQKELRDMSLKENFSIIAVIVAILAIALMFIDKLIPLFKKIFKFRKKGGKA